MKLPKFVTETIRDSESDDIFNLKYIIHFNSALERAQIEAKEIKREYPNQFSQESVDRNRQAKKDVEDYRKTRNEGIKDLFRNKT